MRLAARKRGLILLVLSVVSALVAAKTGGINHYGMFDGPV
jgi:hypothetical protein